MDLAADGVGDPLQRADAAVVKVAFVLGQGRCRVRGGEDGAALGEAALGVDHTDDDMAHLQGVIRVIDQRLHVFPQHGAVGAGHVGEHIGHPLRVFCPFGHPTAAFQAGQQAVHVGLFAYGGQR